ncbi:amidohydrolase [Leifsonia sp. A12D58]|uniref:amidohydrolase n=1 Tax=Leifsonia sp. A12D58 TaxID=3397674 RepID=UPI0039DFDC72
MTPTPNTPTSDTATPNKPTPNNPTTGAESLLLVGNILTMSEDVPLTDDRPLTAEAMLVSEGIIVAVGSVADLTKVAPAGSIRHDITGGWIMPGLIEPHGHPSDASMLLGDSVVDIRPVVVSEADAVMQKITDALAEADPAVGLLANGWDPLLQKGLPTLSIEVLDALAGQTPLVILHNSGHSAYFNSAAAQNAGVDASTPDPVGASYAHTDDGSLAGTANETSAVMTILKPLSDRLQADFPTVIRSYYADLNKRGITAIGDLSWNPGVAVLLTGMIDRGEISMRIRGYEMSGPAGKASVSLVNGTDALKQIGIKIWADGSPWVGSIAASFPYLDTEATRALGLEPHHTGRANYTESELFDIALPYASEGWQMACHAHGDLAIDMVLTVYERLITELGLVDSRFRIEHVGAMTLVQFERAERLGVTVSVFVDHVYYWGDVLIDDLFGPEHGSRWADAGSAFHAGHRASFHNDGSVTPAEPFRNMQTAITRRARSGRLLATEFEVSRINALRAHTTNAAWQLKEEGRLGVLAPGAHADFIVIDGDPLMIPVEELAGLTVRETWVGGRRVF